MSFDSLRNKEIKNYRKGFAGDDVESWALVSTFNGRISVLSPTDIQATAMMIDFNPTHKLYTEHGIDLKQGDKIIRTEDSQEFQVNRVMEDSKKHHYESWISEIS